MLHLASFIQGYICKSHLPDCWCTIWGLVLHQFSSAQFSRSVLFDSLEPHGLQHTNSQNLLRLLSIESMMPPNHLILCHSFLLPSVFPGSGSFPKSQFFPSGDQSIGASASASVLPMNIQDWFPLGLIGLISLQFKGLSRVSSKTTDQKHQFFHIQLTLTSIHD